LAWGSSTNPFVETSSFPDNPGENQSLGRIWLEETGEYKNTGDNSADFEIQTPTPKAENSSGYNGGGGEEPAPSQPVLAVEPKILEFTLNPSSQSISISNTGGSTLSWVGYVTPQITDWLNVYPQFGEISSGLFSEISVSIENVTGINDGVYLANIIIDAGEIEGSPVEINVVWDKLPKTVVINEIAWMGTTNSVNDEWIELYNNTDEDVNLFNWNLKSSDGSPDIVFGQTPTTVTTTISADGFYLLERTDDTSVPDIVADLIYTDALGNNGEDLNLYDGFNNLIDTIQCSSGWFVGDNTTKQTMERKNPQSSGSNSTNWATSQEIEGTPKSQNNVFP